MGTRFDFGKTDPANLISPPIPPEIRSIKIVNFTSEVALWAASVEFQIHTVLAKEGKQGQPLFYGIDWGRAKPTIRNLIEKVEKRAYFGSIL